MSKPHEPPSGENSITRRPDPVFPEDLVNVHFTGRVMHDRTTTDPHGDNMRWLGADARRSSRVTVTVVIDDGRSVRTIELMSGELMTFITVPKEDQP